MPFPLQPCRPLPAHTRMKPCGTLSTSCGWGVPLDLLLFLLTFFICHCFLLSSFSTCCPPFNTLTVNGSTAAGGKPMADDSVRRRWNNSLTFHLGSKRLALWRNVCFQIQLMHEKEQTKYKNVLTLHKLDLLLIQIVNCNSKWMKNLIHLLEVRDWYCSHEASSWLTYLNMFNLACLIHWTF